MSRYCDAVCRLCRREGMKLFLKGAKCDTPKCPVSKRDYPPGMHTWRRGKASEYLRQLREKQKLKRTFGVQERQFRRYFAEAVRRKGNTGTNLLELFESRLDNVVYRMGFGLSRAHARQLINHSHFTVNGKRVDVASYQIRVGDVIAPAAKEKSRKQVEESIKNTQGMQTPSWLEIDAAGLKGTIIQKPTREEFPMPLREQLIVEMSSR